MKRRGEGEGDEAQESRFGKERREEEEKEKGGRESVGVTFSLVEKEYFLKHLYRDPSLSGHSDT